MFGVEPPCDTCDLPDLWPENVVVWEVYRLVAGLGERMMIDLGLLDRLGIKQPLAFLRRLAAVVRVAIENAQRVRENAGS